ncbi:hypothetical protein MaudCBS49596_007379 [Microsporum audouinii]
MTARLCDVTLTGIWNADVEGRHYVDLDFTLRMTSGDDDAVLPVLDIGPNTVVNILGQDVFKLKHDPSQTPDPELDTEPYDDETENEEFSAEEIGRQDDDVSIDIEATSRKLVTRDMRISPSPVKQRLFPPSPDTGEDIDEGENSDDSFRDDEDNNSSGSSNKVMGIANDDNGIFDIPEHKGEPQGQNSADRAEESPIITGVLQSQGDLPDFGHGSQKDIVGLDDTDDKENEVPKGDVGPERVSTRVPLGEIIPKRDSTTVLISTPSPSIEVPVIVNHGNFTPLPQLPSDSIVVTKRTSRSSPQKGSMSRIPVKKIYKVGSHESDHGPISVVGPQDDVHSSEFMHKRNSPIARMAIMARALSNPSPPAVDMDNDQEHVVDTHVNDEQPTLWSTSQSETSTPTKLRLPRSTSDNGLSMLDSHGICAAEGPDTEDEAIQPVDESQVSEPLISFDEESENGDIGEKSHLAPSRDEICITPENSEEPEMENFEIDDFYGDDADISGSEGSYLNEGQEKNIDLPSPSTASQRSMMWHYPGAMLEFMGEYPTLETAGDMLVVRMTPNVAQTNLSLIATVRITLTGSLEDDSEKFKSSLPDTDGHISIPWELKLKPPQVDGWVLKLSMMLPFSTTDEEYDSYITELQPLAGEEELEEGKRPETKPELELNPDSEPEASVEETDFGYCPCCSYHCENSPLVNTGRLMAMASGVSYKLSIGSHVAQALLHNLRSYFDLTKPFKKAGHAFGAMLRNLCGEEGLVRFIAKCIRLALLVGTVSFFTGIGFRVASWSPYSWQNMVVGSQPGVICSVPQKVDPSVCCGRDLSLCPSAAGGVRLGQSVDIAGKEVTDGKSTLTATWAVPTVGRGEGDEAGGAIPTTLEPTENGSSLTVGTAPIRALPGADGPASGLDGADAADEGGNIGSGKTDKANDARRVTFRDRVDWALGWRGPLFD